MADKPSNHAAYLVSPNAEPLKIGSAPYTSPGNGEIIVRNGAVAINPVEAGKHALGNLMFRSVKYPFIMGCDLAGEVVEVGAGVTQCRVGDRVLGLATSLDPETNKSSQGAFQEYTVVEAVFAARIPDSMSYTEACVLPLCLATAASALFVKQYLGLQLPQVNRPRTLNGETLVVWGGSTSVGCNAIQLAVAAGYEVITTASPKNFDYLKKLGASYTIDYRSKTAATDIIEILKGKRCAGAAAIAPGSTSACVDIVAASKGKKFVAQISVNLPGDVPTTKTKLLLAVPAILWYTLCTWLKCKVKGVDQKFIEGGKLKESEVGPHIFDDFLPDALERGEYVAAPAPLVVGNGLQYISEAIETVKKGVSARKLVVTLQSSK